MELKAMINRPRKTQALAIWLFIVGSPLLAQAKPVLPCAGVRARPDAWVVASVNALLPAARAAFEDDEKEPAYNKVLDRITMTLRRCGLERDPQFVARHRAFVDYIATISWDRRSDHELGFNVPDRQYFADTRRFVEIPDYLLTTKFLRAVSRSETVDQAKAILRELNAARAADDQLVFFTYTSRHLGTPDNDDSFRRLLIVVPGDAAAGVPDKWVQFGVTDPGARDRVRNVSIVSAVTHADGTYDAYFKDLFRTYHLADNSISLTGRWELGEGDDNCVKCHKSGVLPIFPVADSVSVDELPMVEEVNRRFRGYGAPRFGGYLDATKLGPGLGTRTQAREQLTSAHFSSNTITEAMSCAVCHQPDGLGSFNWPMDNTLLSSFVEDGPMPLGFKLTVKEKTELYEKLIDEYFDVSEAHPGILKSWLLSGHR
jgi:hypothetical protein